MKKLYNAFCYAFSGLCFAWGERAFRQEVIALIIMTPIALIMGQNGIERALLISSMLLVLMVELLNTGIEKTIDRISSELHPLSKIAKDVGGGAVLISLVNVAVVWLAVLL